MPEPTILKPYTMQVADILNRGGIAVIPTDTIYGIVCRAYDETAVKRLRTVKNRTYDQAFIILCADIDQVRSFDIDEHVLTAANKNWPGKVSVVMETNTAHPEISGKLEGIAFRIPDDEALCSLLRVTGPLAAPSANLNGDEPSLTVDKAKSYFGNSVDIYIDGGPADSKPSRLIRIQPNGEQIVIRP